MKCRACMATVVFLWGAAFALSCMLMSSDPWPADLQTGAGRAVSGLGLMGAFFGGSRIAFAGWLTEKADEYFHRGIRHKRELAFRDSPFQRVCRHIVPEEHEHIGGASVREIMPWLWLATRADPRNIETYLIAAFWLSAEGGRPDIAEQVLKTAQQNNPGNHAIKLEMGRMYLRQGRKQAAAHALDAGLAFWPGESDPEDRYVLNDKAKLLTYRALLYEADGEKEKAVAALREVARLFPERKFVIKRIEELESGEPAVLASSFWSRLLDGDAEQRREALGRHD